MIRSSVSASDVYSSRWKPAQPDPVVLSTHEAVDPGLDRDARRVAGHDRDPVAAAPALERVRIGLAGGAREARPRMCCQAHPRPGHARPGREEVLDQADAEPLGVVEVVVALGECVDGVAHRVGREQAGVVARGVRGGEVALERHVDRQVADVVAVGPARDLYEAHARLAVAVAAQDGGHGRFSSLGRCCSRTGRGAAARADAPAPRRSRRRRRPPGRRPARRSA